jgi:hypothetical protein
VRQHACKSNRELAIESGSQRTSEDASKKLLLLKSRITSRYPSLRISRTEEPLNSASIGGRRLASWSLRKDFASGYRALCGNNPRWAGHQICDPRSCGQPEHLAGIVLQRILSRSVLAHIADLDPHRVRDVR